MMVLCLNITITKAMTVMRTSNLFLCFLTLIAVVFPKVGTSQGIPKKELDAAFATMSKLIDSTYVFPEKGQQIALHLQQEYKKGKFSEAKNWKGIDSLITRSLQEFSHDGHMYVRYDPKTAKELSAYMAKQSANEADSAGNASSDNLFHYGNEAAAKNFGFREVKVLDGNIGYLKLSEINISEKSLPILFAAMRFVSGTEALIIDLRDNGGGGSAVGNVFESFFLPKETPLLAFKARTGNTETERTVNWLLEKKYDKPLFIIVNSGTASAAEAFAYALQRHRRAKVVGQRSAGGAHMNSWYPVNEELFISVSTGAPTWPGTDENWEQKGINPDYPVKNGGEIAHVISLIKSK
jgi:hypothetical protein